MENPYSEIHLREFSRKLNISPNSVNRFLDMFVYEGLVVEKRVANLRYFVANMESLTFRQMKKVKVIREIEQSGLIDELRDVCFSCVLFGSAAKGEDDAESDFDFVIIGKDKDVIRKVFNKFQRKLNRDLSFYVFSSLEWKNQSEKNKAFYQDVISSGINLIGEVPIV